MGPSDWGKAQANAFLAAWDEDGYVGGFTLFGDIESGNVPGSWVSGNYTDNRATLHGFLYALANSEYDGVTPGIYISQGEWNDLFGDTYSSTVPFVLWLAGSNCPTDCSDAEKAFNDTYTHIVLGGYRTMIWQYFTSGSADSCDPGGVRDLDITPYNGYLSGSWNPTT